MKLSCMQENLAKGLATVTRAVPSKSTLPVAMNVLLATDNGRLRLAATNLEIAITTWIGAKIESDGAITVPARTLSEYVNLFGAGRVDLTLNAQRHTVNLVCGPHETNLRGLDAEEFPPIPRVADVMSATAEPSLLKEAIGQVVFAAATEDTRPVLTGVLASFDAESLTLAAADGYRLAVRRCDLQQGLAEPVDVIIPAKSLQELSRILGDDEEPVEIAISTNRSQLLCRLNNTEFVSRLLEGNFPNYRQIIPKEHKTRTLVSVGELHKATKLASVIARDASNVVRLQFTPAEQDLTPGRVTVTSNSQEGDDSASQVDAIVDGPGTQIAFNAKYLAEVLGVLPSGSQVGLEVSSPSSPGVFRPAGDDSYTHVIMPMHVTRSG
ncbi:MAG: DNA polymerase III subunit beta [Chloroflexi bacterium]|nr:DNA polymerase III subunit beta [Chloroflexota bacterium]